MKLFIFPEGGLANRLRVLASAFAIRGFFTDPIVCFWALRSRELNAPFLDLFQPISGLCIVEPPSYVDKLRPVLSRYKLRRLYHSLINRYHGIAYYLYEDSSLPGLISTSLPGALSAASRSSLPVLIRTWQAFGDCQPFLHFFSPTLRLQERINLMVPSGATMVGVHVRRGDHVTSISRSPIDEFFKASDQALSEISHSELMLCTDDQAVRDAFRERYGNKVNISQARLSRNSTVAIQDAVVDMFSLSRCIRIIGSYHSSFSELAAMIGDRPLYTVGLDEL